LRKAGFTSNLIRSLGKRIGWCPEAPGRKDSQKLPSLPYVSIRTKRLITGLDKFVLSVGVIYFIVVLWVYFFSFPPDSELLIMESEERINVGFFAESSRMRSFIPSPFEPLVYSYWKNLTYNYFTTGNYSVKCAGRTFNSTLAIISSILTQKSIEQATGKIMYGEYLQRIYSNSHELVSLLQEIGLPGEYVNLSYRSQQAATNIAELTMYDEDGELLLKMFFEFEGVPLRDVQTGGASGWLSGNKEKITVCESVRSSWRGIFYNCTVAYANISTSFPLYECINRTTYDFTAWDGPMRGLSVDRSARERYKIYYLQWRTANASSGTIDNLLDIFVLSDIERVVAHGRPKAL